MKSSTLIAPRNKTLAKQNAAAIEKDLNDFYFSKYPERKNPIAKIDEIDEEKITIIRISLRMPDKSTKVIWEWKDTGFQLKKLTWDENILTII